MAWGAALALLLAAGCGSEDDSTGDDAAGTGGAESSGDGMASEDDQGPADESTGEPPPAPQVPDNEYCAPVAAWSDAEIAFEEQVVEFVNQVRAQGYNCGGQEFGPANPMVMQMALRCAARVHSVDMAERGFFDHDNPDGEDPFERMERAGYSFSTAGENIAAGQPTPEEVMLGWMDSPGHCRNIMNPDFTEIGVGYASTPGAQFPHYWTQTFGRP